MRFSLALFWMLPLCALAAGPATTLPQHPSPTHQLLDKNQECSNYLRRRGLVRNLYTSSGELVLDSMNTVSLVSQDESGTTDYSYIPQLACLNQESKQLQDYTREKMLVPPSQHPLNLSVSLEKFLAVPVEVPYEVDKLVYGGQQKKGFFIEAGGHDFEQNSDSLHFEINHGWTGLLVEPHKSHFRDGLLKNRAAHSINTCLSTLPRPTVIDFNLNYGSFNVTHKSDMLVEMQCLPLYSILLALGNPTVHYFSLDVEGSEFPILKTIPWDKVDIQVLSIETHFAGELFPGSRQDIIEYMETNGYNHIPNGHKNHRDIYFYEIDRKIVITNDMFVKKGIKIQEI